MTASPFNITPTPPTSLKLEPGQEGKFSFTVTCLAAPDKSYDVILQPLVVGDDGKTKEVGWLGVDAGPEDGATRPARPEPRRTLRIAGGTTVTVIITASPTAASPRAAHSLKLAIADKDRPNDTYAYSSPVACELVAAPGPAKPAKRFPWWWIAAIAGGVLLLGGGFFVVRKLLHKPSGRPQLGEACAASRPCDEGLLCAPDSATCLLAGGAACKQDALCASGQCDPRNAVCAIPLGGTCNPGDKDLVPCPRLSTCSPATKTCLGNVGAPCKLDPQCDTGRCTGGLCVVNAPAVKPGDPCETTCPAPLQCDATKHCVEQLGRPCTSSNQCITRLCEASLCTEPKPPRNCTADGICGPDQKCLPFQPDINRCGWNPGHICTSDAECTSQWCNHGACSRDDGKCDSPSECPSPYLCITAKQRCLKPLGTACGGDAECDSATCVDNRCSASRCVPTCPPLFRCDTSRPGPLCVRIFHGLRDEALVNRRPAWTLHIKDP
jgi:hypothetical protein